MKLIGRISLFFVILGMLFTVSCGKGNVETAETDPVPETEAEVVEEVAAPQTFDAGVIAAVAAVVSLAGFAVSKKH